MNKTLKTLLTLLSIGIIGCSSVKPIAERPTMEGEIDISYVPYRIDDISRKNEIKAGIFIEGILPVNDWKIFLQGGGEAYAGLGNPYEGFSPHKACSNLSFGFRKKNFEIYGRHSSNHPIDGISKVIPDKEGIYYWVNEYDAISEIGIRIKIGPKK